MVVDPRKCPERKYKGTGGIDKGPFGLKINTVLSLGSSGIVVLLFTSICAGVQVRPEDAPRGGDLFVSKGCVKCHAVRGEGGKTAPDLGRTGLGGTQLELAVTLWNHTPSWIAGTERAPIEKPALTGQDFTEIIAYVYFLRFFDEPGNAASGRYLFEQKGCGSCHLVAGRTRDGVPGLDEFPRNASPVFLSQAMWNHSLQMMVRMARIGKSWPRFEGAQMTDTLAFIRTKAKGPEEPFFFKPGNAKEGRAVFDAKGCANCHSADGAATNRGIDLGKRARSPYTSLTQIASRMWNSVPEMILFAVAPAQHGVPRFTAKEMADLLAYLSFLHQKDEPGDASRGGKLFSDLGCAQCHGLDRRRGALMYIDPLKYRDGPRTEIVASIWDHNVKIREATGQTSVSWPRFKKGQMADLLEFIETYAVPLRSESVEGP